MVWPEPPNYYEIPSGVYKVILQQPAYPIIYPDPSFSQIGGSAPPAFLIHCQASAFTHTKDTGDGVRASAVSNIRLDNWLFAGGMTLFGAAAGYYTGACVHHTALVGPADTPRAREGQTQQAESKSGASALGTHTQGRGTTGRSLQCTLAPFSWASWA